MKLRRNEISILDKPLSAQKFWTDEDYLWVMLSDGRQLATPLSYFPRVLNASKAQGDMERIITTEEESGIVVKKIEEICLLGNQ